MSGVALHYVPQGTAFDVAWPEVVGFLTRSCEKGPLPTTTDDYKEACENGTCQLWVATKAGEYLAVAVTEVLIEPKGRVLVVLAVGGHGMDEWNSLEREIANCAKNEMEISRMRGICRPGMMPKTISMGYRIKGYIMERQL